MLTTGVRTPVGIKVFGSDLQDDRADRHADRGLPAVGRRERAACSPNGRGGGYFLDFDWKRENWRATG